MVENVSVLGGVFGMDTKEALPGESRSVSEHAQFLSFWSVLIGFSVQVFLNK